MCGRRNFLKKLGLTLSGLPLLGTTVASLNGCSSGNQGAIKGELLGPSAEAGHKLRGAIHPRPISIEETDVVIIGGGVAGLSAARWLQHQGITSFKLLELEEKPGGNAMAGSMAGINCPWGAHYLPLPDPNLAELLSFLKEVGVVTGTAENGLPIYEEEYLCFDPKERLFYNGHWQQGLMPRWGVPEDDLQQIERFEVQMEQFQNACGDDGKFAFSIPLETSTSDKNFRKLDQISMAQWLKQQNYTSTFLLWYIDYCCRDDYATNLSTTSAWAAIHYFAGRRGLAANSDPDRVLTWPEGNFWLVQQLQKQVQEKINTNALAYSIKREDGKVLVNFMNTLTGEARQLRAKACIMATPQFVNKQLLNQLPEAVLRLTENFTYAPWIVANLTLDFMPEGHGAPISWDNVIYGSKSLGYVYANHQYLQVVHAQPVLTYYMPLADEEPVEARKKLYMQQHDELKEAVLLELEKAHPALRHRVQQLDVWRWGHGMIRPTPGFIWGEERAAAMKPLFNQVFFAHSDLSGISVFEEAFYNGIRAASEVITQLKE